MSKAPKPPCPRCRSNRQVTPVGTVGDMFRCGKCGGHFDSEPDEGGSYFTDPSKRLEIADERRKYNKGLGR